MATETTQERGGYLESCGSDWEGVHVEFYDGHCHVHMLFDTVEEAEAFIREQFPADVNL